MKIDRWGQLLALTLVVTTAVPGLAPPARAELPPAAFAGRVLAADGVTPLEGVGVILLDLAARVEHRSVPTHENGGFAFEVPPGTYTILVETERGAYVAADKLPLTSGANRPLLLAISEDREATPPPGLAAEGEWPTWAKWVVVGAIVVVGAVVINEVTEDGDEPATPF